MDVCFVIQSTGGILVAAWATLRVRPRGIDEWQEETIYYGPSLPAAQQYLVSLLARNAQWRRLRSVAESSIYSWPLGCRIMSKKVEKLMAS